MFETLTLGPRTPVADDEPMDAVAAQRRPPGRVPGEWLHPMLDEIDYGMLLVDSQAQVQYMNYAARVELDAGHALQLLGSTLRTRNMSDLLALHEALAGAQRGLRKLLTLGRGLHRTGVSVVPLAGGGPDLPGPAILLVLGKRQACAELTVLGFARAMDLTPAETRVLQHLCQGLQPAEAAQLLQVGMATVRTQIGHIREKAEAASIMALMRQVMVMPPMLRALRLGGAGVAL